jgi:hypothetical protein
LQTGIHWPFGFSDHLGIGVRAEQQPVAAGEFTGMHKRLWINYYLFGLLLQRMPPWHTPLAGGKTPEPEQRVGVMAPVQAGGV